MTFNDGMKVSEREAKVVFPNDKVVNDIEVAELSHSNDRLQSDLFSNLIFFQNKEVHPHTLVISEPRPCWAPIHEMTTHVLSLAMFADLLRQI
jgi:hypothetical protein